MRPLLLPSGPPSGPKGTGRNQREARNNKIGSNLGQLARCQDVSFSTDVPREPASKHQNRGDEDLGALLMLAYKLIVMFTPPSGCPEGEVQRQRKGFLRLWRWTVALIAMQAFAFFLDRVPTS